MGSGRSSNLGLEFRGLSRLEATKKATVDVEVDEIRPLSLNLLYDTTSCLPIHINFLNGMSSPMRFDLWREEVQGPPWYLLYANTIAHGLIVSGKHAQYMQPSAAAAKKKTEK